MLSKKLKALFRELFSQESGFDIEDLCLMAPYLKVN